MSKGKSGKSQVVVVGGTSGLGLDLARLFVAPDREVIVTGRKEGFNEPPLIHYHLELGLDTLRAQVQNFHDPVVGHDFLGRRPTLIYTAGFNQEGLLDELPATEIEEMMSVGLLAPMLLAASFLNCVGPDGLEGIIFVTSSSEYTPRKLEPVYAATKAGLGMLGRCLAQDERIGKVLVAAPSGMKGRFWRNKPSLDTSKYLDPAWVASQIKQGWDRDWQGFSSLRILRDPPRTETHD